MHGIEEIGKADQLRVLRWCSRLVDV